MKIWQKFMIFLARSKRLTNFIHNNRFFSMFARGFIGGDSEEKIIETSNILSGRKIKTSFFYLGEYVEDKEMIEVTVNSLKRVVNSIGKTDIHVSVDPTQVGLMHDYDYCLNNIKEIAFDIEKQKRGINDYLMIDMEDSSVTSDTVKIYNSLIKGGLPAGITLQAYLRRTSNDIEQILQRGDGKVRLVKGAFAEKKGAYTNRKDIDKNYITISEKMLSKKHIENGFYPVFATHDHNMVEKIIRIAKRNRISKDKFEFEMLYGVRKKFQEEIVKRDFNLRLYTPYGKEWWPYTIRRVGENPKNLTFVLRSLVG
ncbi:MAG: proline dehydrogenase [Desulfobacterales bacterium]|nr:proline dehydrogenase [Desulfobacterales bacterium]MCP4158832.1 proline dehydrogenase [Deltaproteobacteria bacterium]